MEPSCRPIAGPPVACGRRATAACRGLKLLKTNTISAQQSNKTQEPSSLISLPPVLSPYIPTEPQWFIRDMVAALSMRWAKGTLGNFMIHDEASGIILDVCMCHCILIMAPVSWKRRHTFKGDNLIFSSLRLLSTPCWANTLPLNSSQSRHRLQFAPWLWDNKKKKGRNRKW